MKVTEWLERTLSKEIMVRRVTTLRPTDALAHAAGLLLREQMSGAPVVDERGVCVGVLSASDVVGAEKKARVRVAATG
jgi:CBS domain-containing protein